MHIMQMESIKASRNLLPTLHPKIELLRRQQISVFATIQSMMVVFQLSTTSYLCGSGIFSLQPDMRAALEIPGGGLEGRRKPYSPHILFLVVLVLV